MNKKDWEILNKFGITKDNLIYNGDLDISYCTNLTNFPKSTNIKGKIIK